MNPSQRTQDHLQHQINRMSQAQYDAHVEAAKQTVRESLAAGATTEAAHKLFVNTLAFSIAMA